MNSHKITISGVERDLPIRELPSGVRIAFLQLLGDLELCEAAAAGLAAAAASPCDLIATPEAKGIPLAHELARLTGAPYIVLRKSRKDYMASPISEVVRSITSAQEQSLWLDAEDLATRSAERVWLVDDVATTGDTLRACGKLLERAGATVVHRMAVMSEGPDNPLTSDVISLGRLPLF